MKPRGKITALAQFILDEFRILYLEKGISGRKFSREITEGTNSTRVSGFENIYNNETYTPELTKRALNYFGLTIRDILPDELLDDDQLMDKTRIPILKKMSVKAALNSLLEDGYFDTPRLRSEITAYYNSFLEKEDHKENSYFSAQLEDLCNEGKLLKLRDDAATDKEDKLIRFVRNMEMKED